MKTSPTKEDLDLPLNKIKIFFMKLWLRYLHKYRPPKILWESYWPKH